MSVPEVRIYGVPVSTWRRTVRMVCIENGIEHELVPVARASDAHRGLHPFARYPLADLYLAPQLANCAEKAPALLDGLPALATWTERMSGRVSFMHTVQRRS